MWKCCILLIFAVLFVHEAFGLSCRERNTDKVNRDDPSRTCRKACDAHEDCSGSNKKCICDDDCGLSCVNEDAVCPDLVLNGGTIQYKYPNGGTNKTYRTVATYRCDAGHEFFGEVQRTCLSTKQWSHSNIEHNCTRICVIPSGRIGDAIPADYGPFYPGDVMPMKCVIGFEVEDASLLKRTCQTDYTWSDALYVCNVQSCGPPGDIDGGTYEHKNDKNNLYGGRIQYSCYPGYDFTGSASKIFACITRGDDGATVAWKEYEDPWPTCERIECVPPTTPDNGGHDSEGMTLRYNDEVKYHCNSGYELVGNKTLTCDAAGEWGTIPTCKGKFDTTFNNGQHGYTVVRGNLRRVAYETNDGFPDTMMTGWGTIRSVPLSLSDDEKICARVNYKRSRNTGEFVAEAFANDNSVELYNFLQSSDWKNAYFELKPVEGNNEIQLQFRSTITVQIDSILDVDFAECELHTTTKAPTTTPKPTTTATTTTTKAQETSTPTQAVTTGALPMPPSTVPSTIASSQAVSSSATTSQLPLQPDGRDESPEGPSRGTEGESPGDEQTTTPGTTSSILPPSEGLPTWAKIVVPILALIALCLIGLLVYVQFFKTDPEYSGPTSVTSTNDTKPESTPMSATVPDNGVQPENVATPV